MRHFKLKDYIIAFLIIAVTLLYFADIYILPYDIETLTIFGLKIGNFGFGDVNSFVHFSKMKLLILFLLIIWYLNCSHWWKPAILIPIFIEILKLFSIFNSSEVIFDEIELYSSLPFTIPFIILLVILSRKVNALNNFRQIKKKIDDEISLEIVSVNISKSDLVKNLKEDFKLLKKSKKELSKQVYMDELKILRNRLYDEF